MRLGKLGQTFPHQYLFHPCEIDFLVDFTFKNKVFERIAGQYFDRAFRKMVQAFEMRAFDLYG